MPTKTTRRRLIQGIAITGSIGTVSGAALAQSRGNEQNNGRGSDEVTGTYKAIYAWDGEGDWYSFNTNGRGEEAGTVDSIDKLHADTLTTCYYNVQYRGTFAEGGYLNSGWVKNNIRCEGVHSGNYNSIYVHETDPRYHDGLESIWNTWGIFVDTRRGEGNTANTARHPQPHQ